MKTVRCFLAVNLELKTAKKISELQQQLVADSKEFKSKIKWVPPQNMHVTVRFLGNITEPMIQAIKDNLEPTTKTSAPFTMKTGDFSVFDANDLRILYAAITDESGGLAKLVERTHEVLVNTGFKQIEKPYTPHVTFARIKDGLKEEIDELIATHPSADCGDSLVHDLVCYQSTIYKTGADYKLLWKLPLLKRIPHKEFHGASPTSASEESVANKEEQPTEFDPATPSVDEQPDTDVVQEDQEQGEQ